MILRKFGAAAAGACLGMMVLAVASQARPFGTVEEMPFLVSLIPMDMSILFPMDMSIIGKESEWYAFQQVKTPDGPVPEFGRAGFPLQRNIESRDLGDT